MITAAPSMCVARPRAKENAPVAVSAGMREVLAAAEDVAATPTTVLLLGESGTGKEVLARFIHRHSPRADGPWVAVNCAALPSEILESELFGHERGAFTGAAERRVGRVEQADKGTLLLDEISEMPLLLQAKLLRVLQEREVDRVGGHRPISVDVRVIATSNRDMEEMVRAGQFRADLYYRLNVFPLSLPPLRERREDIPTLAAFLLCEAAAALGRPAPTLSDAALAALLTYRFPGNIRELGNLLERALVRCKSPILDEIHLGIAPKGPRLVAPPPDATDASSLPAGMSLDLGELERLAIAEALRRVGGNRTHAARLLGIGLRTLRNKLNGGRGTENPSDETPAELAPRMGSRPTRPAFGGFFAEAHPLQEEPA
jgi:two-component system response regulator FlrC